MAGKASAKATKKATTKRVAAKAARKVKPKAIKSNGSAAAARPVLLSGGNPQIAKGYGEAPVQAYIAAMPGWKGEIGRRLDALVARAVPNVHKAVKWNSPFYGVEENVWFLSFHCFTNYVRVTFFRGSSLHPAPLGESKYKDVRYYDVRQGQLDEAQFADWAKQASRLPGEKM
ncbi:MAG TPA: DUF1801 domain-containing protein [Dongiaceae bacterium]|nr:DUF1801 domain-containing protein [Dongiaceae bacterium]